MLKHKLSDTTQTLRHLFFSSFKMSNLTQLAQLLGNNEELYFSKFRYYDSFDDTETDIDRCRWRDAVNYVNNILASDERLETAIHARGLARMYTENAEANLNEQEGYEQFTIEWVAYVNQAVQARRNVETATRNRREQTYQNQEAQIAELRRVMDDLRAQVTRNDEYRRNGTGHPTGGINGERNLQQVAHSVARIALDTSTTDLLEREMPTESINAVWDDVFGMYGLTTQADQDRIKALYLLYLINNGTSSNADPRRSVVVAGHTIPLSYIHSSVRSRGTLRQFARPQADLARAILSVRADPSAWARKNSFAGERELGFDFADGCSGISEEQLRLINEARDRALNRQIHFRRDYR